MTGRNILLFFRYYDKAYMLSLACVVHEYLMWDGELITAW